MKYMFYRCINFNSNLKKWDVSQVTDMERMFSKCYYFNSDLNKWDVSKVTNMSYMFDGCKKIIKKPSWY